MSKVIKALIIVAFFFSAVFAAFMFVKYNNAINSISNNVFEGRSWLFPENKNIVSASQQYEFSGRVTQIFTDPTTNLITLQLEAVASNNTANKFTLEVPNNILPNSIKKVQENVIKDISFDEFTKLSTDGVFITDMVIVKQANGTNFIKSIVISK